MKKQAGKDIKEKFKFMPIIAKSDSIAKKPTFKGLVTKNISQINKKIDIAQMTKIGNMLKQFEAIFKEDNLGEFYVKMNHKNLWENEFYRNFEMDMSFLKSQQELKDVSGLYVKDVQTKQFYADAKNEKLMMLDGSQAEKLANLNYMTKLDKAK